jgi:hypothetical protein
MKLLYCSRCKDIVAVVPGVRHCFCKSSKVHYNATLRKEVYSGPAILLGIQDDIIFDLKDKLDENEFYKNIWVTIPSHASTIMKVNSAKFDRLAERRGLTTGRKSGTMGGSQQPNPLRRIIY